jgi:hypothetical protein
MGQMVIRDHAVWAKHIEGDSLIIERVMKLPQNEAIILQIDGKPVRFLKMRDGADGRPTSGIRPDETFKDFWNELYNTRKGEKVTIELNDLPPIDPYLAAVSAIMTEWNSPEDEEAYRDL